MRKSRLFALAAILSVGVCAPALAAYDRIGSVNVSRTGTRDIGYVDFGGPVEALQLRASDSDIRCRSVRATFSDGQTQDIFSGLLRQGRMVDADMPGDQRTIKKLVFACSAESSVRDGQIVIYANVGRYQSDWLKSPNWNRLWAKTVHWSKVAVKDTSNAVSNALNSWQKIGSETFEGRDDAESKFTGWQGHHVDAIALMPVGTDARCSRITASFEHGSDRDLAISGSTLLTHGEYNKVDLPGDYHNITGLDMHCHAVGAGTVTIELYVSK